VDKFEEGFKLLDEKFGNGKDNIISLATIAREPGADGKPRPVVREVDAYYEDGAFYVVTYEKSNKMQQIAQNSQVSVAVGGEWFTANGVGENLGWVLDPKNAEIRTKLRVAFAAWYDMANNENDGNCCILAIRLTRGTLNVNHWEKLYHMDFVNKADMENGGIS
jgi:Pyridoxamine 5''-phosphate oxidase.